MKQQRLQLITQSFLSLLFTETVKNCVTDKQIDMGFIKEGMWESLPSYPEHLHRAAAPISCPLSLLNANGYQLSQSLALRQREVPHSQNYATTLPKIAIHLILWVTQWYKMPVICLCQFSSVPSLSHVWLFGPHGPQHLRPPYPSPTPRVYSDSCPLSQWCHPTIWSSVVPFSSWPQSFQAPGSFQMSRCREPAYCILSAALSTASSFRIWNSSTGILSLPGARVRSSTHDKGHEKGGSAYAKAGSSLRSPPGNSRASTPQNQSLPTFCFVLSPTPLTLLGLSPTTSLWKKS